MRPRERDFDVLRVGPACDDERRDEEDGGERADVRRAPQHDEEEAGQGVAEIDRQRRDEGDRRRSDCPRVCAARSRADDDEVDQAQDDVRADERERHTPQQVAAGGARRDRDPPRRRIGHRWRRR